MKILIPKSKLVEVKSQIANFNRTLRLASLNPIFVKVSKPFAKSWGVYHSEFNGRSWVNVRKEERVVLVCVELDLPNYEIEDTEVLGCLLSNSAVFDQLTDRLVSVTSISFTKSPLTNKMASIAFDDDRHVVCHGCNVIRNRNITFIVAGDDKQFKSMSYGCLNPGSLVSQDRFIKWHAFYKYRFEELLVMIKRLSIIRLFKVSYGSERSFGINHFICTFREQIFLDRIYKPVSMFYSTSALTYNKLNVCDVATLDSDFISKFHKFYSSLRPKNNYEQKLISAYYKAMKFGVTHLSAGRVGAMYLLFQSRMQDELFENEVLPLGEYEGYFEVIGIDESRVMLIDGFGRIFKAVITSKRKFSIGQCMFIKSKLSSVKSENGRNVHYMNESTLLIAA